MDTFVEGFASKLDEAKAIAQKMSINQKVEVLKYVFLFVEQLQKDLIEKLTVKGSLVTFSFIPEMMGVSNSMQNVYMTPDSNRPQMRKRIEDHWKSKILPSADEEVEVKCDSFHQTCDELDEHYSQQFSLNVSKTSRTSVALDSTVGDVPVVSASPERLQIKSEPDSCLNTSDSSVSLICLSSPSTRSTSSQRKKSLPAKLRSSADREKSVRNIVPDVASIANISAKQARMSSLGLTDSKLNNGISCPSTNSEVTLPKKLQRGRGRKCRRQRVGGKYMCSFPDCNEKYSNLEHIADHELQHTVPGGHFWPCSQCPQRFKWRHYLRLHLKVQHRI